jgi:hypothetical protein
MGLHGLLQGQLYLTVSLHFSNSTHVLNSQQGKTSMVSSAIIIGFVTCATSGAGCLIFLGFK